MLNFFILLIAVQVLLIYMVMFSAIKTVNLLPSLTIISLFVLILRVSITIYIFVVRNLLMNGFLILLIVHIFNLVFTIIIIAIPVFVLRTVNLQWAVLQL